MRLITRAVVAMTAAALVAAPTAAVAAPDPQAPGDLDPNFVAWLGPDGQEVDAVHPGESVVARYTITNVLPFPIRVNGIDSQLIYGDCVRDFTRASHDTDPTHAFPIYLAPGATSAQLTDVAFTLKSTAACASSDPTWRGNVIGEQVTGVPESSVTTAVATTTTTVTETHARDPKPFYAVAAAAVAVIVLGLLLVLVRGRGRRRR